MSSLPISEYTAGQLNLPGVLSSFTKKDASELTVTQIGQIEPLKLKSLPSRDIASISLEGIAALSAAQVNVLSITSMRALELDQIANINDTTISGMDPFAFAKLTADQIRAMTSSQVNILHDKPGLNKLMPFLSAQQLNNLTYGGNKKLTSDQVKQ
jgi:hypothetical protein